MTSGGPRHADAVWALSQPSSGSEPVQARTYRRRASVANSFPVSFPDMSQYGDGFDADARAAALRLPFQSTTRRGLAADGSHVYGDLLPGALVSQHRYPDRDAVGDVVPYETRFGLVVGVMGRGMGDQVDVAWSPWAPTPEPAAMAASRRVRKAAAARSAT